MGIACEKCEKLFIFHSFHRFVTGRVDGKMVAPVVRHFGFTPENRSNNKIRVLFKIRTGSVIKIKNAKKCEKEDYETYINC